MKKPHFILFSVFVIFFNTVHSQVGIGNYSAGPAESSLLDINGSGELGLLIPNINISNIYTKDPINTLTIDESLLAYNTNTTTNEGYYYWDGSKWERIKDTSLNRPSYTFKSNNNSQDFNNPTYTPIVLFDELLWNDNNDLFEYVNNTTVRVKQTGRYQINAYLSLILNQNAGMMVRFRKNGVGTFGAKFIATDAKQTLLAGGVNILETIQLNENDTFQMVARNTNTSVPDPVLDARLYALGNSFVEIEFIK